MQNVTFTAGQTSAIANINIIDDTEMEGDEEFVIIILGNTLPAGVIRGEPLFVPVTIVDNDGEFFKAIVAILHTECNQLNKEAINTHCLNLSTEILLIGCFSTDLLIHITWCYEQPFVTTADLVLLL